MKKTFILLLISLLICVPSVLMAQSSVKNRNTTIKCQIIDASTKLGVPFVTYRLYKQSAPDKMLQGGAANKYGRISFSTRYKGSYLLVINFIGKVSVKKTILLGKTRILNLGLIKMVDDSHQLNGVTVVAQKPLIHVDLDKIAYSVKDDPDSKTADVLEMLRRVPMLTVDGDDNIQLNGSSNFKIYLNGKPSNMISNNPKDVLQSMPANTVEKVEVITDPGAKYDAEGASGIINIVTKKQTSLGGYVATIRGRADSRGGFGGSGYVSAKYKKFGITASYGYMDRKNAPNYTSSSRENLKNDMGHFLNQSGSASSKQRGQYGSVEMTYELDSLNLLSLSGHGFNGRSYSNGNSLSESKNADMASLYKYQLHSNSETEYGGPDMNVDYQHSFHKKDEMLTASYKYSYDPSNSKSNNDIYEQTGVLPDNAVTNRQFTHAHTNEHTFQIDYTDPLGKNQTLEVGSKYIIRLNNSISGYDSLSNAGLWVNTPRLTDHFSHREDILAAYASYKLNLKKWGFKVGARYEGTWLNAKFQLDPTQNFAVDYNNIVPSATVTYKITPLQNIRLGYNMRITRPGISQLNPYEDTSNPNYITQGNPGLDPVVIHNINLNYGYFATKFSLNANVYYTKVNNSIEQYTTITNKGASYTTYQNIGKSNQLNTSVYLNWNIINQLRLFADLSGSYTDIKANNATHLANKGFGSRLFAGAQYSFLKDYRVAAFSGFSTSQVTLQGRTQGFVFHAISLGKDFLKKRLSLRLMAIDPFQKDITFKNSQSTPTYRYDASNIISMRKVQFSISYRFGGMKAQIKKIKNSIHNDDVSSNSHQQDSASGDGGM